MGGLLAVHGIGEQLQVLIQENYRIKRARAFMREKRERLCVNLGFSRERLCVDNPAYQQGYEPLIFRTCGRPGVSKIPESVGVARASAYTAATLRRAWR